MKKVLMLGDSIRMGYEPYVREGLNGIAEVVAPAENGMYIKHTLWGVNLWMNELGTPDIVHWNNGLWDLHHEAPMVEALTPLGEYLETARRIVGELRRVNARIIFATTTPVPHGAIGRSNAEIDSYNAAACKLMAQLGVEINDLNSLVKQDMEGNISADRLHLSLNGYELCAHQAIYHIKKLL